MKLCNICERKLEQRLVSRRQREKCGLTLAANTLVEPLLAEPRDAISCMLWPLDQLFARLHSLTVGGIGSRKFSQRSGSPKRDSGDDDDKAGDAHQYKGTVKEQKSVSEKAESMGSSKSSLLQSSSPACVSCSGR
jgi:hypothetical protein